MMQAKPCEMCNQTTFCPKYWQTKMKDYKMSKERKVWLKPQVNKLATAKQTL